MANNPLNWFTLLGRPARALKDQGPKLPVDMSESDLPPNFGPMENADGHARITGPCGDTMEFWVRVKEGIVMDVNYVTDGCWSSIASGFTAARIAKGLSVEEAMRIEQEHVLKALGGLPKESEHCALLSANTLKAAMDNFGKR
jgi:nitrogen fixation NifU-like protein